MARMYTTSTLPFTRVVRHLANRRPPPTRLQLIPQPPQSSHHPHHHRLFDHHQVKPESY
ncbi:hypothetical protein HanIR_Chr12g0606511 [Helianthus annuus]|nr:hypothetical protein HanIR_Chr12g0606511 [Helianthus annuus]